MVAVERKKLALRNSLSLSLRFTCFFFVWRFFGRRKRKDGEAALEVTAVNVITLTVNIQLRRRGPTLHFFYKIKDPIRELNYLGTKCEIGVKMGDQKCNFA